MISNLMQKLRDKLNSPFDFLVIVIFAIFFAEATTMLFLSAFENLSFLSFRYAMLDSSVLVILIIPILYMFLYIPMKMFISEKNVFEEELLNSKQQLEKKVNERTAELVNLNKLLQREHIEELTLSEEKYKTVVDNLNIGVVVLSPKLEVLSFNKKMSEWFPNVNNAKKQLCYHIFNHLPLKEACESCPAKNTIADGNTHEAIRKIIINNEIRYFRSVATAVKDKDGRIQSVIERVEDFTERQNFEEKIIAGEEKATAITNAAKDAIIIINHQDIITNWNPACETTFGFTKEQAIGKELHKLLVPAKFRDDIKEKFTEFLETGTGNIIDKTVEVIALNSAGNEFPVEISISAFKIKEKWHAMGIVRDITSRKQTQQEILNTNTTLERHVAERTNQLQKTVNDLKIAEQNALKAKDFYLTLFEEFPALIWRSGKDGKCDYFNKTWLLFTGQKLENELGEGWTKGIHPEDFNRCMAHYLDAFKERRAFEMEYRLRRHDGEYRWVIDRGRPYYGLDEEFLGYIGVCYDTTEQEISKYMLKESEDRYKSLIKQSSEGIFVFDPVTQKVQEANIQFLTMLGYSDNEIINLKLEDIVYADKRIIDANLSKVIKDGETFLGLRKYKRRDGLLIDVEASVSLIKYGNSEVCLVNVRDVTERKLAEAALKTSFNNLKVTLDETVNALVTISEKRDPYTAGHQNRVAKLACAIAEEMGLTQSNINGILIAGKLHDIGKIYVPTDILNKPGHLSDIEFALIKTHSTVGYDILKDVPFESPVADIIVQHHERINGTGYPNGLKQDEMLLEAKILGVADVVEAMVSHRPYRPSLGIEKALSEIKTYRGIHFDAQVVDACLHLFEKGYSLEKQVN